MCAKRYNRIAQQAQNADPQGILASTGSLDDPGGVSLKPQGVSHKPHLAAEICPDSAIAVAFAQNAAAELHGNKKTLP